MKPQLTRWFALPGAFCLALLWSSSAFAYGSMALTLTNGSLNNVTDADGTTQYDTGTVSNSAGTQIGYYQTIRRVHSGSPGPGQLNTASEQTVLFFPSPTSGATPNTITLQGAHIFSSGDFNGSVSAASERYSPMRGADASSVYPSASVQTLTIHWVGVGVSVP